MINKKLRVLAPISLAITVLPTACAGGADTPESMCLALPDGSSVRVDQGGSAWNEVLIDREGRLWRSTRPASVPPR